MTKQITDQELLSLTEEQAAQLLRQGDETVIWALLRLVALAKTNNPLAPALSTPSSQIPPYQKPAAKKGRKKRGRPEGHEGTRRATPLAIDRREEHSLAQCPECGGPVGPSINERRRIIEDIEKTRPVTTEHTIHSHWCPKCRKRVEPRVTDALPKSTIGNSALVLGSWFHYGLGQTTSQVAQLFDSVFHFPVSASGLVQQWMRLADILLPWYEQIAQEARESAVLNVDETGWRVNGKTHWLWCFTALSLTLYDIDPTRSSAVPSRVLAECFEGIVVSDFYGAYNVITGERQLCLVHLLREIEKVNETNQGEEWKRFGATLKRIVKDAIRLSRREDRETLVDLAQDDEAASEAATGEETNVDPSVYRRRVNRIHLRLDELISHSDWSDADCTRLVKRLEKYRHSLFTFLDNAAVPFDNNRAEREIRPAVIARKNSFHNASERGAATQAILMSIYRTLKLRGLDPVETLADALTLFIATGQLSALPAKPPG